MVLSSLSDLDLRGHCRCLAEGRLAVSPGERCIGVCILGRGHSCLRGRRPLQKHPYPRSYGDHYLRLAVDRGVRNISQTGALAMKSNQALERTADRRENLLSMTSTLNPKAQLALVSGRSACYR